MNRTYRSIWNRALGAWVAVPETARTGGGQSTSHVHSAVAPASADTAFKCAHPLRPGWWVSVWGVAAFMAGWAMPVQAQTVQVGDGTGGGDKDVQQSNDNGLTWTPAAPASPSLPWDLGGNGLSVGENGAGLLRIGGGGQVSNGNGYVANGIGSSGTVAVEGSGSQWSNSGNLLVGVEGAGFLNIRDGGQVTNIGSGMVGANNNGTVTVSGKDAGGTHSQWAISGVLNIGLMGTSTGTLDIADGGIVSNTHGIVGTGADTTGTVTVKGAGSQWSNSGDLYLGSSGTGTLRIEGGGQVRNTDGYAGENAGGAGAVTVTGAGSQWINSGELFIGYGGRGTLNIEGGGQVSSNFSYLGKDVGSNGTATVKGAGSLWDSTYDFAVGQQGTGSLSIESGGKVTNNLNSFVGSDPGSAGAVTVKGLGTQWSIANVLNLGISGKGTLGIEAGAQVSSVFGYLGKGPDGIGSVKVQGVGSLWTNVGTLFIGTKGAGSLSIEDGGQVSNSIGIVGEVHGSTGIVTVNGSGSEWLNSGTLQVGIGGQATLRMEGGGKVSASSVSLGVGLGSEASLYVLGDAAGRGMLETGQLIKGPGTATVYLDGGVLRATRDEADFLSGFAPLSLGAGGVFFDTNGYQVGVSTVLGSAGRLVKQGSGTLTLTGANTYMGGTTITNGTLALKDAGSLAAAGTVDLNGNGAVLDISAATLGARTIGALTGAVGTELTLGAQSLVLGNGRNQRFAGTVTGHGNLVKQGAGVWTLAGNSSAFTGSTTVQAGTLALENQAVLGGSLAVDGGGTLTGSGVVGNTTIANGGVLAPGSGAVPGTLTVNGNLAFRPGSFFRVLADPASAASSRVEVTGTATLAGSVLHVGPQGNFDVARSYTIVQAGSVQGQFASVASLYDFLTPSLRYGAQDVTLQLVQTAGFASKALTFNQAAAASGAQSLPDSHALYQALLKSGAGTATGLLTQFAADPHGNTLRTLPVQAGYAADISLRHAHRNLAASLRAGAPLAQSEGRFPAAAWPSSNALPAWAELVGHWQSQKGDGNAAGQKQHTGGLFLGGDEVVANGWRLGGSLGYTRADGKVADRSATSVVDSYSAAVYGGKSFGYGQARLNVLGGVAHTWHDIATTRQILEVKQTLKADYRASTTQLFAEVGYALGQYRNMGVEPFAGITVAQQRTGSFQETGGFAAVNGQSHNAAQTSSTLGVRIHSDFRLGRSEGRFRASLGWRHAFGNVQTLKTLAFDGGQNFTVAGTPLARDTALVGLEAELELSRNAALVLGYQGEFGGGSRDHAAKVKLRWAF